MDLCKKGIRPRTVKLIHLSFTAGYTGDLNTQEEEELNERTTEDGVW